MNLVLPNILVVIALVLAIIALIKPIPSLLAVSIILMCAAMLAGWHLIPGKP